MSMVKMLNIQHFQNMSIYNIQNTLIYMTMFTSLLSYQPQPTNFNL